MNSYRNEDLYKFILNLLEEARVPFKDAFPAVLSEQAYEEWKIAFVSASKSKDRNYEMFEALGDAVLKYSFWEYLYKKFPNERSPGLFSQANNYFTSKRVLSELSKEVGFVKFIQADKSEEGTMSLAEDVFEAFIGATSTIFDQFYREYTGGIVAQFLVKYIFDRYVFKTSKPLASYPIKDYVSRINEDINQKKLGITVRFFHEEIRGKDRTFTTIVVMKKNKQIQYPDIRFQSRDKAFGKELAAEYFYKTYWENDVERRKLLE